MTENPWSREHFDLDRQTEMCEDGTRDREVYGLLLDAGWPPQKAHGFMLHIVHRRRLMKSMEGISSPEEFIQDARKREDDEQMKAMEPLKVSSSRMSINLANFAIILGVIYLMASMMVRFAA